MNLVKLDGIEYDLDTVSPQVRELIEQQLLLTTDLARLLTPADELQNKLEAGKKALLDALISSGDTIKLG